MNDQEKRLAHQNQPTGSGTGAGATLRIICPSCRTTLRVAETLRGKPVRCPKCKTATNVAALPLAANPSEIQDAATIRPAPGVSKSAASSSVSDPGLSRSRKSIDTQILERLARYEEMLEQGSSITPEELCQDSPELLEEVKRRLVDLKAMRGMLNSETARGKGEAEPSWPGQADVLPTIPGFEVLGVLGRGGMGVVYKARQVGLKRLVALKMILSGAHAGADQRARFLREAEAVARLQHAHIVQIHQIGEHEGNPYFSLEYCNGGSLAGHLKGMPLPAEDAAHVVRLLAQAMHVAHDQNIIHRDLKPANVLLANGQRKPSGPSEALASTIVDGAKPGRTPRQAGKGRPPLGGTVPKITDFGLAKHLDEVGQTASGAVMGTPSYMAPEQASGETKTHGPAADIYALGAILYECLTGRPPFKAANSLETIKMVVNSDPVPPSQLNPKTPSDLETICLKCLQKEPKKRYASAAELADDLTRFENGEPISARPVGRIERAWRWCRRNPVVVGLVATLALVGGSLATLIVGMIFFWPAAADSRVDGDDPGAAVPTATPAGLKVDQKPVDGYSLIPANDAEVMKALDLRVNVDFKDQPFKEVLDSLEAKARDARLKIRFTIDELAFNQMMIDPNLLTNDPVTRQMNDGKIRTLLRTLLAERDLAHYIDDGAVVVTTKVAADMKTITKIYPFNNALGVPVGTSLLDLPKKEQQQVAARGETLMVQICGQVEPEYWEINGGRGKMLFNANDMSLLVRASLEVHYELLISGKLDNVAGRLVADVGKEEAEPPLKNGNPNKLGNGILGGNDIFK